MPGARHRRPAEPTTKPTWESMTPEEREEYVNQDVKEEDPRIFSGSDKLEMCESPVGTYADVYQSAGYIDEETEERMTQFIDPVELECIRRYYGEGQSYRQIGESISVLYVTKERVIKSNKLTKHIVHKLLASGRKGLQKYYESKKETH